jgi:hypothetical protein
MCTDGTGTDLFFRELFLNQRRTKQETSTYSSAKVFGYNSEQTTWYATHTNVTQCTRGEKKLLPSLSGRASLSREDAEVNLPVDGGEG